MAEVRGPLGERGILVACASSSEAAAVAAALRRGLPGAEEVVSGLDTVLVVDDRPDLRQAVVGLLDEDQPVVVPRRHEIPVVLDGPDLVEVLDRTGLDRSGLLAALSVALTVATVGFSPGFAYLEGIAGPLAGLARRATPRPRVPAGSLAVAAGMVAIYPQATPGGWWLLGRSPATLFDPTRTEPGLLRAGDEVRLVLDEGARPAPAPPERRHLVPPEGATPVLEVRAVPPGTMVVDGGRRGVAHLGVPASGAADPERWAVATRLVGGAPGALEVTGSGLELAVLAPTLVAGVDLALEVDGRIVPPGVPVAVAPGSLLRSTAVGRGVRGYLGVAGGPLVPPVLGSMATDVLCGVGPGLAVGDVLGGGPLPAASPVRGAVPEDPVPRLVRFVAGPHRDWCGGALDGLVAEVSPTSNRVGLRVVPTAGPLDVVEGSVRSLPTVRGAIQLPPDGHPIILGPDRATLGGYPLVGVVVAADHGVLGRLGPGEVVQLCEVGEDEARRAEVERRASSSGWVSGSAPTLG